MNQLVQISINGLQLHAMQSQYVERPGEVVDFVEALSRMFGRIGMHDMCKACFRGELQESGGRSRRGRGCCGLCPNLGHQSCLAKPVGCATYMCYATAQAFPDTEAFLLGGALGGSSLASILYLNDIYGGCFPGSVLGEAERPLTERQRKTLRVVKCAVESWPL